VSCASGDPDLLVPCEVSFSLLRERRLVYNPAFVEKLTLLSWKPFWLMR
jgi:hypothetical protein